MPWLLNARRAWLWLHRWTGLTLGLMLALVALLGSLLTVIRPLDQWAHWELFQAESPSFAQAMPLEPLRQRLAAEFGPGTSLTFRPAREPGESLRVNVRGKWDGTVYLDPATGRELGRRGVAEGVANWIFELHSELLLGEQGKATLALVSMAYLLLLITGLILWWPTSVAQWKVALRMQVGQGNLNRSLFDLHRVGGAVLGLFIAVLVATGTYMAWRPIGPWLSTLVGDTPVKPPKVGPAQGPRQTLDELVATAQARWPEGRIGYVQAGGDGKRPVRVRLMLPDDPHPNGLTSVWLHPVDGRVLAQVRWNQQDLGGHATAYIYPLHTGELGGTPLIVVTGLLGLTLTGLGVTGLWLWWRRRRA